MQNEATFSDPSVSKQSIDAFCQRWHVSELLVDAQTSKNEKESGLGLQIRFDPTAEWSLRDRLRLRREFETLTGQEVRLRRRGPQDGTTRATYRRAVSRHAMRMVFHA